MMPIVELLVATALIAGMILLRVVVERSATRARLRSSRKNSECDIDACPGVCGMPKPASPTETNT